MSAQQTNQPAGQTQNPAGNRIVWLASYPKSGNTWVRFLLHSAINGPPERSIDIARTIPDLHRPLPFDPPAEGPLLVKTHFALTPKHPRLSATRGAIHIVRHPKDVLRSALNYARLAGADESHGSDADYARTFIRFGGDAGYQAQGFGTWATHAKSWRSQTRFPVLELRYEDLKRDPTGTLREMLAFIGIERDGDRIVRAVAAASFDNMRALEVREKHAKKDSERLFIGGKGQAREGRFFMNKGASGGTLDEIAPGLDAALDEKFAGHMRELGY